MHPAVEQIRQYLQLIALQFVQHPEQAELRVAESPQGLSLIHISEPTRPY